MYYALYALSFIFIFLAICSVLTVFRFLKDKDFKKEMNTNIKYKKYGKFTDKEVIEYGSITVCIFIFLSYLCFKFVG